MSRNSSTRHLFTRSVAFAWVAALATPSAGASELLPEPAPTAMAAEVCEQASIDIEIDVATGEIHYIDPATGSPLPLDGTLEVGFGSLGHVVVELHYSSSEWLVIVTPDAGSPTTYQTNNGSLRYSISTDVEEYTFDSQEVTSTSAMMNMLPTIPTFKLRTKDTCEQ